jgi:hypothetical protein
MAPSSSGIGGQKQEGLMYGKSNAAKAAVMNERGDDTLVIATERFERRLAEESGKLRVELATGFGGLRAEMQGGFGNFRAEMIDRNSEMLKWILGFLGLQLAAIAGLLTLFR